MKIKLIKNPFYSGFIQIIFDGKIYIYILKAIHGSKIQNIEFE